MKRWLATILALCLSGGAMAEEPLDCDLPYAAFGYEPVVVQDFGEMVKVLGSHAEQGNYCAQYELGMILLDGVGVAKEPERALHWIREAAAHGHGDAMHTLGLLYTHGVQVERNVDQAIDWYYRAGLAFLAQEKDRLALREVDYIMRERPGHPRGDELREQVMAQRLHRR